MKVSELIEILSGFPSDLEVKVQATYDCGYGTACGTPQYVGYEDGVVYICSDEG